MAWRQNKLVQTLALRLFPNPSVRASVSRLLRNPSSLERAIRLLGRQRSISIVQIGAFVGHTDNDPLFRFVRRIVARSDIQATVVLIEPVKEYFEKLKNNYGNLPGIIFENVAIAESSGERDFYHLAVDPGDFGYPDWLAQLGSLNPERMGALWDAYEKTPEFAQFFRTHQLISRVQCLTLHDLMKKHHISEIDLLQIDAEGYDYEILKTINFSHGRGPRFINYERVLLLDSEPACRAMLEQAGYKLADYGQDTLATRRPSITSGKGQTGRLSGAGDAG